MAVVPQQQNFPADNFVDSEAAFNLLSTSLDFEEKVSSGMDITRSGQQQQQVQRRDSQEWLNQLTNVTTTTGGGGISTVPELSLDMMSSDTEDQKTDHNDTDAMLDAMLAVATSSLEASSSSAQAAEESITDVPLAALVPKGQLPPDHKPARGRGRHIQLKKMTPEQRRAERIARAEKNRQAAREFRVRRKNHMTELESKVKTLEAREQEQQQKISELQWELNRLQSMIKPWM